MYFIYHPCFTSLKCICITVTWTLVIQQHVQPAKQQIKHQSSTLSFFDEGNPSLRGWFPSQRASISLSWHHHALHCVAPHIPASLACLSSIFTPRVATAAVNIWHTVFNTVFSITAKVSEHKEQYASNEYVCVFFCKREILRRYMSFVLNFLATLIFSNPYKNKFYILMTCSDYQFYYQWYPGRIISPPLLDNDESRMTVPSNFDCDGKIVCVMVPSCHFRNG